MPKQLSPQSLDYIEHLLIQRSQLLITRREYADEDELQRFGEQWQEEFDKIQDILAELTHD